MTAMGMKRQLISISRITTVARSSILVWSRSLCIFEAKNQIYGGKNIMGQRRNQCMSIGCDVDGDVVVDYCLNDVMMQFKQKDYKCTDVYKVMLSSLYENKFEIEKVIINEPAMIVFWKDGTKTVVKAKDETFDPEKGLAMAYAKKALGNNYAAGGKFKAKLKHAQIY
jgi:hypothetical protein